MLRNLAHLASQSSDAPPQSTQPESRMRSQQPTIVTMDLNPMTSRLDLMNTLQHSTNRRLLELQSLSSSSSNENQSHTATRNKRAKNLANSSETRRIVVNAANTIHSITEELLSLDIEVSKLSAAKSEKRPPASILKSIPMISGKNITKEEFALRKEGISDLRLQALDRLLANKEARVMELTSLKSSEETKLKTELTNHINMVKDMYRKLHPNNVLSNNIDNNPSSPDNIAQDIDTALVLNYAEELYSTIMLKKASILAINKKKSDDRAIIHNQREIIQPEEIPAQYEEINDKQARTKLNWLLKNQSSIASVVANSTAKPIPSTNNSRKPSQSTKGKSRTHVSQPRTSRMDAQQTVEPTNKRSTQSIKQQNRPKRSMSNSSNNSLKQVSKPITRSSSDKHSSTRVQSRVQSHSAKRGSSVTDYNRGKKKNAINLK